MGASNSKPQVDKAMLLCRERKRLVRQAIEWRHALAVAHVSYLRSLESVGIALRKLVEPAPLADSSLYTSTNATPEPFAFTDKAVPRFSYASPSMSNHVEAAEILSSPTISSPRSSRRVHVNHMKSSRNISTTIKEEPNIPVPVTVHNSSNTTTQISHTEFAESSPPSPTSSHSREAPPWDYFDIFPSVDNTYPFEAGTETSLGFEEADYLEQLREEEGIPDLEEEGERDFVSRNSEGIPDLPGQKGFDGGKGVDHESEQESGSSSEGEVVLNSERHSRKVSRHHSHSRSPVKEPLVEEENLTMLDNEKCPVETMPDGGPTGALILKGNVQTQRGTSPDNVVSSKDFVSSIKDIELLFLKASESGKEVQRMLEANNMHYPPNFAERKAQVPGTLKLITWHQSPSALSSSSRNPLASTSLRDDVDDSSNDYGDTFCMNSGSHASTLDRLYAWERKLSDEVKASGFIRREYDMQCKQLRHLQARDEKSVRIDKTRARVKDLHSRILVAIQRIDSISRKIEELRDKELHPQLEELVGGLAQMWKMMFECHQNQHAIVTAAYLSTQAEYPANSQLHRQLAIDLVNELSSLNLSFTKWMSAQKSYLKSLYDWLLKCVPQRHKSGTRRKRQNMQFSPRKDGAPPIFVTCRDWFDQLNGLPVKEISCAVKNLAHEVQCLFPPEEDKRTRDSKLTSLSWKIKGHNDVDGYRPVDLEYRETHANLHSGFDSLRSRLVDFFEELVLFAAKSSEMYEYVKTTTLEAHVHYHQDIKK
ncbi:hypothetical protein EJ110_NYTH17934 [Nymphaea thermarum]|nr:hypothetical protein EJ110_NYTH17934 [Nymphaea thermarum]